MKLIDLLNKIANGERPKIIKVKLPNWNYEYEYDKEKDDWYNYEKVQWFDEINLLFCLNDEVEIIEEDKKIEKLVEIKRSEMADDYYRFIMQNRYKINELIEEIEKLKESK